MKFIVDFVLLAAALSSVFYTAGLGDVPKRVRFSVLAIGPSFMLTFLLHLRWVKHLDYGIAAICASTIIAAAIGYHFNNTGPMTKAERAEFAKRFAIILSISVISTAIAVALILKMNDDRTQTQDRTTTIESDSLRSQPTDQEKADTKKWEELQP